MIFWLKTLGHSKVRATKDHGKKFCSRLAVSFSGIIKWLRRASGDSQESTRSGCTALINNQLCATLPKLRITGVVLSGMAFAKILSAVDDDFQQQMSQSRLKKL